mmetsp:Transcript_8755/g.21367  ORF Transcript_8755/g.21367 Transcript_8755/m.21367 type:complete len:732 (-) Transcript_8755:94-2289(-)|eukprot:CAMPEP_0197183548 /NCGR_PEP_ID=MMETSP1423-20130617/7875_1 /TAXON_ID=476441 /ORGANISM="Pseudo-nitzschia heimii, Strain UNC1101" /LENGTH=731 /DNA_ID=CAMNT_0042634133 /DNA_START=159 /DNA_END=2354 /DNA_ORIENTATION=+
MKINSGGKSPSDDEFDDINTDEENRHDQLPSPEEYKAKNDGNAYDRNPDNIDNPQDGDDNHDLPTVDEYKRDLSFREKQNADEQPRTRAGLYTFLCLVLLLIIVTAIAVPLASRNKRNKGGGSPEQISSINDGSAPSAPHSPKHITATPVAFPTRPPTMPPTMDYSIQAKDYLITYGFADAATLADPTTPQAKAYNWITNEDGYKEEIDEFNQYGGDIGESRSITRFAERYSLAVLFYSTGGDSFGWRYKMNFLEPIDHCEWFDRFVDPRGIIIKQGVTECKMFAPKFDGYKVSKIEISNNNLRGQIPNEIRYFPYIKTWITPFNADLTTENSLDPFLHQGEKFTHLELQYCGITGTIPQKFGTTLTNLNYLGLGNNFMEGEIPDTFFNLNDLIVLGLDDNLLSAPIDKFARLKNIQKLYIEDNLITGTITEDMIIDGWQNMIDLDISVNRLEGPFPTLFWNMTSLEVADLHGNDFMGQIPEILEIHEKMTFFAVQDNNLEGRLPNNIAFLPNLKHLDISANKMTMPFPEGMSSLTNLASLYTGINGFYAHPIPQFLGSLVNLRELSMKQNQLTGQIPAFMGFLTNLHVLDLDFNALNGPIPSQLGQLALLDTLMLNRNYLTGTIPDTFMNLQEIDILLLDANNITGNTDVICLNTNINATVFSSDCAQVSPEISCSCCTICCDDSDTECNNFDWRVNLDGIWEYDFQRVVYSFSQEIMPASAKEAYANPP